MHGDRACVDEDGGHLLAQFCVVGDSELRGNRPRERLVELIVFELEVPHQDVAHFGESRQLGITWERQRRGHKHVAQMLEGGTEQRVVLRLSERSAAAGIGFPGRTLRLAEDQVQANRFRLRQRDFFQHFRDHGSFPRPALDLQRCVVDVEMDQPVRRLGREELAMADALVVEPSFDAAKRAERFGDDDEQRQDQAGRRGVAKALNAGEARQAFEARQLFDRLESQRLRVWPDHENAPLFLPRATSDAYHLRRRAATIPAMTGAVNNVVGSGF